MLMKEMGRIVVPTLMDDILQGLWIFAGVICTAL